MANRNQNRNKLQSNATNNAGDAEFGVEFIESKKVGKKVGIDRKGK
ncbi:hypothetical protein [Oceanobacillus saliphilus]|nr:hypothetical protein [Oceanobacillus saliphilus]